MDLEQLLALETREGTYDSTGSFTLSLAEARRKLQKFQLRSLEFAVLKWVQAAVRQEAQAVWMASRPDMFAFYWAEPEQPVEAQQLAGDFEKVLLGADGPARDLAIGLLGFLDKEPKQVWWASWEFGKSAETINLFGGQKQVKLHNPPDVHWRTYGLVVQSGRTDLLLQREAIAPRLIFCPIPLLWNGRLLSELAWNPPAKVAGSTAYWADFYYRKEGSLARGLALKPIGPARTQVGPSHELQFECRPGTCSVVRRYVMGERGRELRLSGRAPSSGNPVELNTSLGESIWVVSGEQDAQAVLLCVKYGVMLDPCTLPKVLGGTVAVVATPDLEVDLSQFAPILQSDSWRALALRLQEQARQVVQLLGEKPMTPDEANGGNVPGTWAAAAVLGGALGALVLPVGWVAGAVIGFAGGYMSLKKLADHRSAARMQALRRAVHPVDL